MYASMPVCVCVYVSSYYIHVMAYQIPFYDNCTHPKATNNVPNGKNNASQKQMPTEWKRGGERESESETETEIEDYQTRERVVNGKCKVKRLKATRLKQTSRNPSHLSLFIRLLYPTLPIDISGDLYVPAE